MCPSAPLPKILFSWFDLAFWFFDSGLDEPGISGTIKESILLYIYILCLEEEHWLGSGETCLCKLILDPTRTDSWSSPVWSTAAQDTKCVAFQDQPSAATVVKTTQQAAWNNETVALRTPASHSLREVFPHLYNCTCTSTCNQRQY